MPNSKLKIHHRRSIRLEGYDYYQPGAYFVTFCTNNRTSLFGDVVAGKMYLNELGSIVRDVIDALPSHYPSVEIGSCVVMPNHVHAIVIINQTADNRNTIQLSEVVRFAKSFSANRCNKKLGNRGTPVWQRNYFEHIIRDEQDLNTIYDYIETNPVGWADDEENPRTERKVGSTTRPYTKNA
ncbi:transposase [Dehalogenimonas formicexedens]|nr:transposase [Dehalogenimonas formicexedens]